MSNGEAAAAQVAAADALERARARFIEASKAAEPTQGMIESAWVSPIVERVRRNYSLALHGYKIACRIADDAGVTLTPQERALAELAVAEKL